MSEGQAGASEASLLNWLCSDEAKHIVRCWLGSGRTEEATSDRDLQLLVGGLVDRWEVRTRKRVNVVLQR